MTRFRCHNTRTIVHAIVYMIAILAAGPDKTIAMVIHTGQFCNGSKYFMSASLLELADCKLYNR